MYRLAPRIFLSPPHLSGREPQLLLEALQSNWIAPHGPDLDAFEHEFAELCQVPHAVALASGTASLHLALLALGVGSGDEVLTSTLTFAATANAIRYAGAVPVFLDSEARTWNLDPAILAEELDVRAQKDRLPAAVLVVDLFGQCADYEPILEACDAYGVPVIEDAAESLGATYRGRPAGTLGAIGCYSFNGNKIITTSGGGMLTCRRVDWSDRVRFLATQAKDSLPHYEHREVGYNYRLSNLLAAVGRAQLPLLTERIEQRRATFEFYRQTLGGLPGIDFMPEHAAGRSTRWLTCLTVDPDSAGINREDIRVALEEANIESRPVWKPMHLQPAFRDFPSRGGSVAERLFRTGLCLPSGSTLTDQDRMRVAECIRSLFDRPY